MAGESIGKLVVDMLLNDKEFRNGLDAAKKTVQTAGPNIQKTMNKAMKAVTAGFAAAAAAAAAFGVASAVVGSGFEKQMSAVAAVRGITNKLGEDYVALEKQARSLGKTTAFSATEAAEGMEALARAGLSTTEIVEASEVALKLAGAGQIELGRSAEIVAASMAQFGLEASDAGRISDVFTAATQNSLFATEDLAQAMKFAGTVGAGLGHTIEETTAAVAQFRNLGLEGSMAGTQFRKSMLSLAAPTEAAKAAISRLNLDIDELNPATTSFKDIMIKLGKANLTAADASDIFGARAALNSLKVANAMAASTKDFDELSNSISNSAGLTNKTYETMMDNVSGQMSRLRSVTEDVMIAFFDTFKGPLSDLLGAMVEAIGKIGTALSDSSGEIEANFADSMGAAADFIRENSDTAAAAAVEFITTMQELVRNIGPVIALMAKMAVALASLIPLMKELQTLLIGAFVAKGVFSVLGAVTQLTPAIGALTAAIKMAGVAMQFSLRVNGVNAFKALSMGARAFGVALVSSTGGIALLIAGLVGVSLATGKYLAEARSAQLQQETLNDVFEATGIRYATVTEALIAMDRELQENAQHWNNLNKELQNAGLGFDGIKESAREALVSQIAFLEGMSSDEGFAQQEQLKETKEALLELDKKIARETQANLAKEARDRDIAGRKRKQDSDEKQAEADKELARIKNLQTLVSSLREAETQAANDTLTAVESVVAGYREQEVAIGATLQKALDLATTDKERAAASDASTAAMIAAEERLGRNLTQLSRDQFDERQQAEEARLASLGITLNQVEVLEKNLAMKLMENNFRSEAERLAFVQRNENAITLAKMGAQDARVASLGLVRLESVQLERQLARDLIGLSGETEERRVAFSKVAQVQIAKARASEAADEEKNTKKKIGIIGKAFKFIGDGAKSAFSIFSKKAKKGTDDATKSIEDLEKEAKEAGGVLSAELGGGFKDLSQEAKGSGNSFATFWDNFAEGAGQAVKVLGDIGKAMAVAGKGLSSIFDFMTGGLDVNPQQIVKDIIDAKKQAEEKVAEIRKKLREEENAEKRAELKEELAAQEAIANQSSGGAAAGAVQGMIDEALQFVQVLVEAMPAIMQSLIAELPNLFTAVLAGIPDIIDGLIEGIPELIDQVIIFVEAMIVKLMDKLPEIIAMLGEGIRKIITSIFKVLPDLIESVIEAIPQLIEEILSMLPIIIRGITKLIPRLIVAIIKMIPVLLVAFTDALPEIIVSIVESFITELLPAIPVIIVELIKSLMASIGDVIKAIGEAVSNVFLKLFEPDNDKDGDGVSNKDDFAPNDANIQTRAQALAAKERKRQAQRDANTAAAFSGIDFIPATMRMTVHKGERVVSADRNAQAANGPAQGSAPAGFSQNFGGGGGGGGRPIEIAIIAEGRLLDSVQMQASQRGTGVKVSSAMRRAGGVKVGFDKGRFSAWSNS